MRRLWAVCLLLGLALALAPEEEARAAVEAWLKGEKSPRLEAILRAPPEEAARLLERYARFPPPPRGLRVNLDQPEVREGRVLFPAALGEETGEVGVVLEGGEVVRIYFRPQGGGVPRYLLSPEAGYGFLLLSLLLGVSLLQRGSPFRLWLQQAWGLVRAYRGVYLFTNLLLYGLFALGEALAYGGRDLARALQFLLGSALDLAGVGEALGRGVPVLAGVIFHWNFLNGLFLTGLLPALLLGLPVLLLNALRYLVFGFALSPALLGPAFLLHLPTLVLELQAYILVTFGGLVLLQRVLRGEGYRAGLRALLLSFYLATLFLLLAAWYEAWELNFLA